MHCLLPAVLGVYPESTASEGSYLDPEVAALIKAHNLLAQRGTG